MNLNLLQSGGTEDFQVPSSSLRVSSSLRAALVDDCGAARQSCGTDAGGLRTNLAWSVHRVTRQLRS
jgi:hypothetical protein